MTTTPTARDLFAMAMLESTGRRWDTAHQTTRDVYMDAAKDCADTPSGAALLARADAADAAQQSEARLREALRYIANQLERYWEHGDECATWGAVDTDEAPSVDAESCDCGVADLYRRAALAHPGPSSERCAFPDCGKPAEHPYHDSCHDPDHITRPVRICHPFTPAQPEAAS